MKKIKNTTQLNRKQEKCLSTFFEYFDMQVSDFFENNLLSNDEEKIVGAFIFNFKLSATNQNYRNLIHCLYSKSNPLNIKIATLENNKVNESKTGWDLVIILDVKIENFETLKFGLFQAKRLYLDNNDFTLKSKFNSLNKKTKSQALKMQKQTKSSYYIFFSPLFIQKMKIGIRITTTETVLSLNDLFPSLETIYPLSMGFNDFMIKLIRCEQGDTNLKNLRKLFETKKRQLFWSICIRDRKNIEESPVWENEEIVIQRRDWQITNYSTNFNYK